MIRGAILLVAATGCSAEPATLAAQVTVEPNAVTASAAAMCGNEPLSACPLQSWMDATLAPTFKRKDFAALGAELHDLAGLGPEGWSGWQELAEAGAAAAHKGSIDGVRAVCAACHARFRSRYRAERRSRPLLDTRGEKL